MWRTTGRHGLQSMGIRVGIVGCGKVGHMHAIAYQRVAGVELVAACDSDFGRAKEYEQKYGIVPYDDVGRMVRESSVEAVSICTPHPLHAAGAVAAMEAGAHVMIEKPLASTLKDCDAIINAAEKFGKTGGTICQNRFKEPCRRIRKAIDDGKIGKPVLGIVSMLGWRDEAYYKLDPWRGSWKHEGGGVLINQAPHQIDLIQWYMGPVKQLYGRWANLNHPYIEVDDTAIAVIVFESGALGSIVVSNSQNPALHGRVQISGSNGSTIGVKTDGGAMFIAGVSAVTEPPVNDIWTIPGEESLLPEWQKQDSGFFESVDINHNHYLQLLDFIRAINEEKKPLIDLKDGRKTVEIITAIYRTTRDNEPVSFPLYPEAADETHFQR